MPVLLGGVMIIEAVVLFAGFKFLAAARRSGRRRGAGRPRKSLHADAKAGGAGGTGARAWREGDAPPSVDKKKAVEINVVDFKRPTSRAGRTFLYDVTIFAVTKGRIQERRWKTQLRSARP